MDRGGGRGHRPPDGGQRRGRGQGQGRGGRGARGLGNGGYRAQNNGNDGQDGGQGRGRGGQASRAPRVYRPVGYGLIEEKIEEFSCEELLLWLLNDRGFEALLMLERIEKPRLLTSTLKAILRAMDSGRDGNSTQLLIIVRDSPLFKSIPIILTSGFSLWNQREMTDIVEKLVHLLDVYMKVLPSDSADIVEHISDTLTLKLSKLLIVPDLSLIHI